MPSVGPNPSIVHARKHALVLLLRRQRGGEELCVALASHDATCRVDRGLQRRPSSLLGGPAKTLLKQQSSEWEVWDIFSRQSEVSGVRYHLDILLQRPSCGRRMVELHVNPLAEGLAHLVVADG